MPAGQKAVCGDQIAKPTSQKAVCWGPKGNVSRPKGNMRGLQGKACKLKDNIRGPNAKPVKPKGKPAHALCKAVAIGHRHPLHQLQLGKCLSVLVGHVLIHRQPALHALDLALLHADLLELIEDVLGHAVLQTTGGQSWF